MDRRRAGAVRALGDVVPGRLGVDLWRGTRRDLERVAARRRPLEPAVGARCPRRVPEAGVIRGTGRRALRKVISIRRQLFPSREAAAWKRAWHQAELTPRFTPGTIRMLDYRLQYSDLLSFCVQWQDIFVKRCLDFQAGTDAPRILDCGAN